MSKIKTERERVSKIIYDGLKKDEKWEKNPYEAKVHHYWILSCIEDYFPTDYLHNKIRTYSSSRSDGETDSGVENLRRGARKVWGDTWRRSCLMREFWMDDEGFVRKKEKPTTIVSTEGTFKYDGQCLTISEWSQVTNIKEITLRKRIMNGWPLERVFGEPVRVRSKSGNT